MGVQLININVKINYGTRAKVQIRSDLSLLS